MSLLADLPPLRAAHTAILGVAAALLAGGGFYFGSLRGEERADAAELRAAQADGERLRLDLLLEQQRQGAADTLNRRVVDDVAQSERQRAALEQQAEQLRQQNSRTGAELARTRDALRLFQSRAEAFTTGAPGADAAACAAIANRARVVGDLLRQSGQLLEAGLGLLQEGRDLATAGADALGDTADAAERYGDAVRGWTAYDDAVVHPRADQSQNP